MAKYKTDLIDKLENTSNYLKWIVILIAAILSLLIIYFGMIFPEQQKENTNIIVEMKNAVKSVTDTVVVFKEKPQNKITQSKKETANKSEKKPANKPTTKRSSTKKEFKNSLDGYKIVGVVLPNGNLPATVYLKKSNNTKKLNLNDNFLGYRVSEIHRTYILLKSKNKSIHLNYIN